MYSSFLVTTQLWQNLSFNTSFRQSFEPESSSSAKIKNWMPDKDTSGMTTLAIQHHVQLLW